MTSVEDDLQRTCHSCGQMITHEARFCGKCGSSVDERCWSCGAETMPEEHYCEACGVALEREHSQPSETVSDVVVDELTLADSARLPAARLRRLSTWITVLFAIHAILRLSLFTAHQSRAQWLRDYSAGLNPDLAALDQAESLLADWTPLSIILLPGAVLLAVWSRRATKNLRSWGETTKWGTTWSAWGWFVPIMWFFVPYLVVRAAFRQSPQDLPRKWSQKFLGVVWAVCFFGFWIARAALSLAAQWWPSLHTPEWAAAPLDSAIRRDALSAAGEVLLCVVSVLTIVVVRAVSNTHESKISKRSRHQSLLSRRPILLRSLRLIALGAVGLILFGLLLGVIITGFSGLPSDATGVSPPTLVAESAAASSTNGNVVSHAATIWSVGDCVAIPPRDEGVRQVPCSSSTAGGTVVAIETNIDRCPSVADLGLEISTSRVACIDDKNYDLADIWRVGACVTFDGDVVEPVDCASDQVNGHVIATTSDPDQCPARAESYVNYDEDKVACLSNIEVTAEPAATRGVPQQQEFNEADEREYLRLLDRGARASLRYRMLALVGEDVIDDWTHKEFLEALTARQPGTREMALQAMLDEQLIQELFKAARLSMQLRGTSGSLVPSQLGNVTDADAQAVSSLIESLEERAEGPQRDGPQVNLIDSAYLRSLLNQQFQLRVGRKASSREQQSFVNEIHAAQRAGLTGASLDPVARAGEFAEKSDPFGAAVMKRLNAGRTIREALQGTGR